MVDFFVRPPTLTTGNFEALLPSDFKLLALKDLNPFRILSEFQEASNILWVDFVLSNRPYFTS